MVYFKMGRSGLRRKAMSSLYCSLAIAGVCLYSSVNCCSNLSVSVRGLARVAAREVSWFELYVRQNNERNRRTRARWITHKQTLSGKYLLLKRSYHSLRAATYKCSNGGSVFMTVITTYLVLLLVNSLYKLACCNLAVDQT